MFKTHPVPSSEIDFEPPVITSTREAQDKSLFIESADYGSESFDDYYQYIIEVSNGFVFFEGEASPTNDIKFSPTIDGARTQWTSMAQIWGIDITTGGIKAGVIDGNLAIFHRAGNYSTTLWNIALFDSSGDLVSDNVTEATSQLMGSGNIGNNVITLRYHNSYAIIDKNGNTTTPLTPMPNNNFYLELISTPTGYIAVGTSLNNASDLPTPIYVLDANFEEVMKTSTLLNFLSIAGGISPEDIYYTHYSNLKGTVYNKKLSSSTFGAYEITGKGLGIIIEESSNLKVDGDICTCFAIVDSDTIRVTSATVLSESIDDVVQVITDGAIMRAYNYDGGFIYALRRS